MPAGEPETSAPSLEQILWRAMDRFREAPALVDAEEFAEHIAHAFTAQLPEEAFADRFFAGAERLHRRASFAEPATAEPLHVYEFDLGRLEYVIVEDKNEVVVVSEFGQFRLQNDDTLGRALDAAVVAKPGRGAGEPRAYFVRSSGEVVGVEVAKVARTLERLKLRQVSMPAVAAPGKRLASFNPRRRAMSAQREQSALQQLPPFSSWRPDAGVAPPAIGSASRWEQMLGGYSQPVDRQVTVSTDTVMALVTVPGQELAGVRALAGSETLEAVRGGEAPVAALGGAAAAEAFTPATRGTREAPDRFWVQPENALLAAPGSLERTLVARPLQLGEITGDPWADWTLTAGAPRAQPPMRAVLDPQPALEELVRRRAGRPQLEPEGAPIVAFRAPDGALVFTRSAAPVRLGPAGSRGGRVGLRAGTELVPKAGALPSVALRALHIALERTAAAGGYRLPAARLDAARVAVTSAASRPQKERRGTAHLAAPVSARDHAARLLIAMPFPNGGQLHVGEDLAEALHAYLAAPVTPVVDPAAQIGSRPQRLDKRALRAHAARTVSGALVVLELPAVRPLAAGAPSISDLPLLLRHAVAESGSWTARPGGSLPLSLREAVELSPFAAGPEAHAKRRPPGPGEEEIVIPLPLWARLGHGSVTDRDLLFLSATPKAGEYRPVTPDVPPFDRTPGPGSRAVEAAGPGGLRLPPPAAALATAARIDGSELPRLDAAGAPLAAPLRIRAGESTDLPSLDGAQPHLAAPEASWTAGMAAKPHPASSSSRGAAASATRSIGSPTSLDFDLASPPSSGRSSDSTAGARELRLDEASRPEPWSAGATLLAGFSRPLRRQAPLSLRFRYVSAPLWWTTGTAAQVQEDLSPETFAARRAGAVAGSAAEATPASTLAASAGGEPLALALDAAAIPAVLGKADAPGAAPTAIATSPAAVATGPAYLAMSARAVAGPVPAATAARARAQAIEMSIVAAAPPAPPPLATMSSSAPEAVASGRPVAGAAQAKARAWRTEAEDAVSHSKIEGSVDAIAQRIYHRIRRRLQSDRERFGG